MAWLAVEDGGLEYLFIEKPERIVHHNVFRPSEIDFKIWASNKENLRLEKGSIKKLIGRNLTWEDEPVEI